MRAISSSPTSGEDPGVSKGRPRWGRRSPQAHAAGRCVGGFDNQETPKQTVEGNYLQLHCRGTSPGMANKLVKFTFPQISIICLLKYKLWRWTCDLNFLKSSKAKYPESWLFWTNLCFFPDSACRTAKMCSGGLPVGGGPS